MLSFGYPFDACQLPLNVFDASFRSFEQRVLPELLRQRIAPIGMKSLCGHGEAIKKRVISGQDALRYAMSLPVATTVSGIDSMQVLKQNIRIASGFKPLTGDADGAAAPSDGRTSPPTDASSATRPRRNTTATKGASSTASRFRKSWRANPTSDPDPTDPRSPELAPVLLRCAVEAACQACVDGVPDACRRKSASP